MSKNSTIITDHYLLLLPLYFWLLVAIAANAQTFNASTTFPFNVDGANGSCATPGSGTPNVVTVPVSGIGTLSSGFALTQVRVTMTDCGSGTKNMNAVAFRVMAPGGTCVGVYNGGLSTVATGSHTLNLVSSETCLNNPATANDPTSGATAGTSGNYGFFNAQFGGTGTNLTSSFTGINANGNWQIIFSESTASAPCIAGASLVFGDPTTSDQSANGNTCAAPIVWTGSPICASTNSKTGEINSPGSNTGQGDLTLSTFANGTCAWNANNNNDVWIKFTPTNTNVCISISGLDFSLQSIIVTNPSGDGSTCTANGEQWNVVSCPRDAIYTTTSGSQLNQQHCFTATVGNTYYLVVDGNGGAESSFYISGVSGFQATDCNISALTVSNASACNDNGTPADATDDYYTADVTVSFTNKPTTGTLNLSGTDLHSSNTASSIAVGLTTTAISHTFSGVRIKANGSTTSITAAFSAAATCTFTSSSIAAVASCSAGGTCGAAPSINLFATSGSTCSSSAITVSGNTFSNASNVTVTANGAGSITAGASSSSSPFSFTYTPATGESGSVTVTVTTNDPDGAGACVAATATYTLTVDADPGTADNTTSTATICEASTKTLSGTPATGTWSIIAGGGSISGSTYTPANISTATTVTVRYSLAANGACAATSEDVSFTVTPTPDAPTASVTTQATCAAPTGTITVTAPSAAAGTTYTAAGVSPTSSVSNATGIFSGLAPNTYNITATVDGCVSAPTPLTLAAPTGCSVSVIISDPCNCANRIVVGGVTYARETITITSSGSGETWTLSGGSGLFSAVGVALPTDGSIVLSGSGTTYTLVAYVPANGVATYTASFTNGAQNASVNGGSCAVCCTANNGAWQ
ncbi:MAG: hypothetical protein JNM36_15480 [Chitinophagales bacterium]|nr:hypothetical protein [Chitinophagales bacterium]